MAESVRVSVGGANWDIPRLPLKHIKHIVPLFAKVRELDPLKATVDQMEDLYEIAFQGLQGADPSLTRDKFENLPITLDEMLNTVIPTVAVQAGLRWGKADPAGEALPESPSTSRS